MEWIILLLIGWGLDLYLIYLHWYNPITKHKKAMQKEFASQADEFYFHMEYLGIDKKDAQEQIKDYSYLQLVEFNKRLRKINKNYEPGRKEENHQVKD